MAISISKIVKLDATALRDGILSGEWTSFELLQVHYELIDKLNHKYNAVITQDRDKAFKRAKDADTDFANGIVWGRLHGIPVTIKDSILTEQIRTTVGHENYKNYIPDRNAEALQKLLNAGAIIIGKTNCAMYCGDIQTTNKLFGTTNNPYNTNCTAGGSSGGEAVAVSTGMSALGLGSDTAGSIRIPASYCGVYGFKPTSGKVSIDGLLPILNKSKTRQDSLSSIGPIARSIRDLRLCYEIIASSAENRILLDRCVRINWVGEFGGQMIDDEVSNLISEKMKKILTIKKVTFPLDLKKMFFLYGRLNMFEFMQKDCSPLFYNIYWAAESFFSLFQGGLNKVYEKLKVSQHQMSEDFDAFFKDCDCWIWPTTPSTAFEHQKAGRPLVLKVDGKLRKCGYQSATLGLTFPANLLGNPSIAIPIGKNGGGLPISIQLVGRKGEDQKLLAIAESFVNSLSSKASAHAESMEVVQRSEKPNCNEGGA